jgi:photosystem II stability/assembly factor-like uncharacterized protein
MKVRKIILASVLLILSCLTNCVRFEPNSRGSELSPIPMQYGLLTSSTQAGLRTSATLDGKTVWAFGDHGVAVTSHDGGKTWAELPQRLSITVNGSLVNSFGLFVTGTDGLIYRLDEEQWLPLHSGNDYILNSLAEIPDKGLMIAVGDRGTVVTSSDHGRTWRATHIEKAANLQRITAIGNTAWTGASDGVIWRSSDTGKGWLPSASGLAKGISALAASSDGNVVVAGSSDGNLSRSADGGKTWILGDTKLEVGITDIAFLPDRSWVAAGVNGLILRSTDGISWKADQQVTNRNIAHITVSDQNQIFVGAAGFVLVYRPDAGYSVTRGDRFGLNGVITVPGFGLLAYGAGGLIMHPSDNTVLAYTGTYHDLRGLTVSESPRRLWGAGYYGVVVSSADGVHWSASPTPRTSEFLNAIAVSKDSHFIVAVGDKGTILSSQDSGQSWQTKQPTSENLTSVYVSGNRAVAVGINGAIVTSKNGGLDWQKTKSPGPEDLFSVIGTPSGMTFAFGESGTVAYSADFGETWHRRPTDEGRRFRAAACKQNCQTIVAVGDSGAAAISRDSGVTWNPIEQGSSNFRSVTWNGNSAAILVDDTSVLQPSSIDSLWTATPAFDGYSVMGTPQDLLCGLLGVLGSFSIVRMEEVDGKREIMMWAVILIRYVRLRMESGFAPWAMAESLCAPRISVRAGRACSP